MLAYCFVIFAVAFRFLPHSAVGFHFTPVAASLLFFGSRMPRRQAWVPVALLAISDVLLTKSVYGYPLTADHLLTLAWYAGIILLGSLLKERASLPRIAGASLASSVSFFLLSNFAVWAVWNMYPMTAGGLAASYTAGLPFFRNTVASDMFFSAVFFGVPAVVEMFSGKAARGSVPA